MRTLTFATAAAALIAFGLWLIFESCEHSPREVCYVYAVHHAAHLVGAAASGESLCSNGQGGGE